jgi:hypothetical protein
MRFGIASSENILALPSRRWNIIQEQAPGYYSVT